MFYNPGANLTNYGPTVPLHSVLNSYCPRPVLAGESPESPCGKLPAETAGLLGLTVPAVQGRWKRSPPADT